MKAIANIFLSWRSGIGKRRHIIGIIKKNITRGVRFSYIKKNIENAKKDGFRYYTDFPDLEKEYKDDVLDIFGQRLTKSERSDIQDYYKFWEINNANKEDKYYLLAHTQGLLATDNFEFLAEYKPIMGLSFVSEICGLSHNKIKKETLSIGDYLTWEKEPNNKFDKFAVKLYHKEKEIGYIKQIHNKVFYNKVKNISIEIKSISTNNEYCDRIFIKISINN